MQEEIAGARDGLFFISVHQIYELWFHVILHELEQARDALAAGAAIEASQFLARTAAIEDVLAAQVRTLETIKPQDFTVIRDQLGSSSGFQSAQFREIEFLSGLKDEGYLDRMDNTPQERRRLQRRLEQESLRDALFALLNSRRITDINQVVEGAAGYDLFLVCERLLDHDAGFARWRALHALTVERLIGGKPGTGGSEGVSYLRSTRDKRFFPELWEARTRT